MQLNARLLESFPLLCVLSRSSHSLFILWLCQQMSLFGCSANKINLNKNPKSLFFFKRRFVSALPGGLRNVSCRLSLTSLLLVHGHSEKQIQALTTLVGFLFFYFFLPLIKIKLLKSYWWWFRAEWIVQSESLSDGAFNTTKEPFPSHLAFLQHTYLCHTVGFLIFHATGCYNVWKIVMTCYRGMWKFGCWSEGFWCIFKTTSCKQCICSADSSCVTLKNTRWLLAGGTRRWLQAPDSALQRATPRCQRERFHEQDCPETAF